MRIASLVSVVTAFVGFVSALAVPNAEPAAEHDLEKRAPAVIYTKCTGTKRVALTFDDGPYIWDGTLQNTLSQYGAKATFFVNVRNWGCSYDDSRISRSRSLLNAGHEFGSHTYSHKNLATLNRDQINTELSKAELWLNRVLGVQPRLMRPPYGSYNTLVRDVVGSRNQSIIMWDFDSGDTTGKTAAQSQAMYKSLLDRKVNTVLALNHNVVNSTINSVVPYVLKNFRAAGYQFVTVSTCLGISPYQWRRAWGAKNYTTWVCN